MLQRTECNARRVECCCAGHGPRTQRQDQRSGAGRRQALDAAGFEVRKRAAGCQQCSKGVRPGTHEVTIVAVAAAAAAAAATAAAAAALTGAIAVACNYCNDIAAVFACQ